VLKYIYKSNSYINGIQSFSFGIQKQQLLKLYSKLNLSTIDVQKIGVQTLVWQNQAKAWTPTNFTLLKN
jgi:hypothetical protein